MYDSNIPGWMTPADLSVLHKLAGLVPHDGSIIEIGCFLGRSTDALFNGKHSSTTLTVVDTFQIHSGYEIEKDIFATKLNQAGDSYVDAYGNQNMYRVARNLAKNSNSWLDGFKFCMGQKILENIELHKSNSKDFELDPAGYDMAFIDASHDHHDVMRDVSKFITNQKTLIVGDDFEHAQPGVVSAVVASRRNMVNGDKSKRLLIVPEGSKIWMLVPVEGYWKEKFKEVNSCFFE